MGRQSVITYADANSGVYFLCISEQIETDTGEPAVIALDIVITPAFEAAKMRGEQKYFFVRDADGVVIYHPNTEFMPHDGQMIQLADAHSEYAKLGSLNSRDIINIEGSMRKAELGARIAGETAQSLTEIVEGINESSSIISEIARYTMKQNESINELNGGMQQVAQVVQVNSSTAQESAASAQEMSTQSYILSDIVAKFKLRGKR